MNNPDLNVLTNAKMKELPMSFFPCVYHPNRRTTPKTASIAFFAVCFACINFLPGCSEGNSQIDPPTGKTGDQWTEDDFKGKETPLATVGGPEFVAFCIEKGTCELDGEILEKFREIIKKYPLKEEDGQSYDEGAIADAQNHFSVVVRNGLIKAGLVPPGDPNRYQYKISMGFIHYGG